MMAQSQHRPPLSRYLLPVALVALDYVAQIGSGDRRNEVLSRNLQGFAMPYLSDAKALGLTGPSSLLTRADEVIE